MDVAIIDYGAGNVKSLQFALERLGVQARLTHDWELIQKADKVIFPGQGAAASAIKKLTATGLDQWIPQLQQPVLGICLGMQLLCSSTAEGNSRGLGLIKAHVERFPNTVKVPQMGWNTIFSLQSNLFEKIEEDAYMYFVHSYFVPVIEETIAQSDYSGNYSVALQKDNFYGVQFHPEKSSTAGQQLLENFLKL